MNQRIAHIVQAMNDRFRSGNFVRKSRAGVEYHVPFSRRARFIQPGKPTSDDRVYRETVSRFSRKQRSYLVLTGPDGLVAR